MKNRLYMAVLVFGVLGIFILSYKVPAERFRWEDERQIKNLSENDEKEVSFQKKEELSLRDKFNIIYSDEENVSSTPIIMHISFDEKDELDKKGKAILEELMVLMILTRDDDYVMEYVQKELYMEVTDSVNIVIVYSFAFSDSEGNRVMMDMDGDTGKVLGFMERRKDLDSDIQKKARKYVDYLGGNYLGLQPGYFNSEDDLLEKLIFEIGGQSIEYYIINNEYIPYYKFGVMPVSYAAYDSN